MEKQEFIGVELERELLRGVEGWHGVAGYSGNLVARKEGF